MNAPATLEQSTRTAREVFGWDDLLPGQAEAIDAVVGGRDTLVVFPTGAGKSAVYQIAGCELGGVTVVISPLLALQRDQIDSIDAAPDAPAAVAINSRTGARAKKAAWAAIESGDAVYAFLAPEQLANTEVLERLAAADVHLIVVDEAHCVSAWGHDFRPDYARIGDVVEALGRPPVLALTATASAPVRDDIVSSLGMRDPHLEVRGMDRPEIHMAVRRHEHDDDKRRAVIADVQDAGGPALLYVATRKETDAYADELAALGLRAAAYHGAMAQKKRDEVHTAWSAGELDVVVATSAFGMGSTRATCGSSSTPTSPNPSTRTPRRSVAPRATVSRHGRSCTTAPRTSRCAPSSPAGTPSAPTSPGCGTSCAERRSRCGPRTSRRSRAARYAPSGEC